MGADLQDDYDLAGFGNRLGFGQHPALLVVDFVRAYLDASSPLYAGVENTVAPAAEVLDAAREAQIPVIYTVVTYGPDGQDGGLFYEKVRPLEVFVGDSDLGRIIDELAPREDELIVTKQYASAFFGTSLSSTLRTMGVDTTILVGLSTSGCIRASAVDAIQLGFRPIVVADAVGDRDERPHRANLFDLAAKYSDVLPAAEVIDHLRGAHHQDSNR